MSIKSFVVRRVDSRLKSKIRCFLYKLSLLKPRPIEQTIIDLCRSGQVRTFIQIGANDGQYADPLNLAITSGFMKGLLVEPNPHFFEALKKTYEGVGGLEFRNVGIADRPGTLTLFTFDKSDHSIPAWLLGSSSFSRRKVEDASRRIPNAVDKIRTLEVPVITIEQLLENSEYKSPDLIVVDAEGYDHIIVGQILDEDLRPKAILYESESISQLDENLLAERLDHLGYNLTKLGQDSLALRRDEEPGITTR